MGRLRLGERQWPSPKQFLIALAASLAFGLVVAAVDGVVEGLQMTVSMAVIISVILAFASLVEHRIHERALVTGKTFPGTRTYIIPWNTVDADRVRLHHNGYAIGQRLENVAVRIVDRSWRLEQIGLDYWHAITIPGLHYDLAEIRERQAHLRVSGLEGAAGRSELEEQIYWEDPYADFPFPTATWILSVRRPKEFLQAMEEAMVATGREDARGLAGRVLANPVRERWRNPLTDEEIYGTAELDDSRESSP